MKITIIGNQSKSIYNFRKDLIAYLLQKHEISIIAKKDDFSTKFIEMGCKFFPIYIRPRSINIFFDLLFLYQLFKRLTFIHPDLVISYTVKPNIYSSLICRAIRIKCLPVITGLGNSMLYNNIKKVLVLSLYKFSLKKIPEVWFLNQSDLNFFVLNRICNISQARNIHGEGINLDFFKPNIKSSLIKRSSDSKFSFLYFGRIIVDKGINELLDAFQIICLIYPHVKLSIIGDFDLSNKNDRLLRSRILRMHENGDIEYQPSVADVREIILQHDCIVLPSYREGLSRALMETASMAKPIIASNVPGCHELVLHNKTGILLDNTSPICISNAMKKILLLDRAILQKMGNYGRRHILLTCNIENTYEIYSKYIDSIK